MEVEFVYKDEIIKHVISPLKTIFYLKNLAANSFNLNKRFIQIFYKENRIKNDNVTLKNYFNNEKYVLLIVKYFENNSNINTVNNSFETSLINDKYESNKKYNNYLDKLNSNRKRVNTFSSTKKLFNKLNIIKPKRFLLENLNNNNNNNNNSELKINDLKINFNKFFFHKNSNSEITTSSEPKIFYEICLECSKENVNFYCRNCNNFICKNCYKKNHLNHKIIIIEKGNINQALLKYQKNLINELNENENKLFNLLNEDQKDFTNLLKNLIEEIKNEFFNFAKVGDKILKIYPNFDYFDKINRNFFLNEKKKILNEFENSNENNNYFQDFQINKNKNNFLLLQKYELILKDLKKNIENIYYKCQFKYLFISILNHFKTEFKEIIDEIEKIYDNYNDKLKKNNQNKFFNSIKNFIENYKNLYNIELNFENNSKNENINLDEPILKKNLQNKDLINKSNPYYVFLNIVNFDQIIKSEKNDEKKINNSKYSSFRSINKINNNPSSSSFSNEFDSSLEPKESKESNNLNLNENTQDEKNNIIKKKDIINEIYENKNGNNVIDKRRRSNLYLEDKIQVSNKFLKSILSLKKKKKKKFKI